MTFKEGLPFSGNFLQRYEILHKVGEGAMGIVFKGRHLDLGRTVAIKCLSLIHCDESAIKARFRQEAKLLASIDHPNVVSVYEFLAECGMMIIVEEFLDGAELQELINDGNTMPWQQAAKLACQIASGLVAIHRAKIIHRDLKPGNTILLPDGTVKIVDFGLARAPRDMTRMTETGAVLGTPLYMAPEQLLGEPLTETADCYALGVMLYRFISGKIPHDSDSLETFMANRVVRAPSPLMEELPEELNELIEQSLSTVAEKRPTSQEMYKILKPLSLGKFKVKSRRKKMLSTAPIARPQKGALQKQSAQRRNLSPLFIPLFIILLLGALFTLQPKTKTGKEETVQFISWKTTNIGTRTATIEIISSAPCRAALVVTAIGSGDKVATVVSQNESIRFSLTAKGLLPDVEYETVLRLRKRGRDMTQKKAKIRMRKLQVEKFLEIAPLLTGKTKNREPMSYSGTVNQQGQMFLHIRHLGSALFNLKDRSLIWTQHISGGDEPQFYDDSIICLTNDEKLYALSLLTGEKTWSLSFEHNLSHDFVISMDTIFVLERAHGVHAIDAATGKPLWKFNKKLLTNPMVAWQDLLLVRTDLLETRAFKVKTGEEVLGIQMLRGHLHPKQWIVDGKDLFACMESGRLVVGNPFYPPRFTIDRKARFFSLTVSPKMVFVYSTEPPVVYAFDRLSGEQV